MATSELTAAIPRAFISVPGIPVLLYHGLKAGPDSGNKYELSVSNFRVQLNEIRQSDREFISLREFQNATLESSQDRRVVAITFDDGQESDYELGLPTLLEFGFRADFFINTSKVGESTFLSWRQIREMRRAGMGIHSHSHDHVALSLLSIAALQQQLRRSKELLEDHINESVEFLAAPYGFVNRRVVEVALEIGYKAVCHSLNWPAHPGARLIPRVAVYSETSLQEFKKLLCGQLPAYLRRVVRGGLRYIPKQLLLRYSPNRLGVRVLESQA